MVVEPLGGQGIQAGDVAQKGDAGRVEVDADEVDAAFDDQFERLLELLGVDVVLVQADADILGLDLDQFGQRILEPAADGDGASGGGIVLGELVAAGGAGRVDAGAGLVDDDVGELAQETGRPRGVRAAAAGCRGLGRLRRPGRLGLGRGPWVRRGGG